MNTVKTIISYSTKIISIIIPIVFVVDCLANCKLMGYYPLSMFSYVTYILMYNENLIWGELNEKRKNILLHWLHYI